MNKGQFFDATTPGSTYGKRPTKKGAVEKANAAPGWRVYGTNQAQPFLPVEQAVLAYREEFQVERNFGRRRGKTLLLTPMYLQEGHRATGLIRLLLIGLRVLTMLEGVACHRLAESRETLAGGAQAIQNELLPLPLT